MTAVVVVGAVMQSAPHILKKMALYVSPTTAVDQGVTAFAKSASTLCHLNTARGIVDHPDPHNIIWMFGAAEGSDFVFHSLLTDRNNQVLRNHYQGVSSTVFDPDLGFYNPNSEEWLPVVSRTELRDFYRHYFKPGYTGPVTDWTKVNVDFKDRDQWLRANGLRAKPSPKMKHGVSVYQGRTYVGIADEQGFTGINVDVSQVPTSLRHLSINSVSNSNRINKVVARIGRSRSTRWC